MSIIAISFGLATTALVLRGGRRLSESGLE